MVRAKRTSALKARTAVHDLSSSLSFLDDPNETAKKESESDAEVASLSSGSEESFEDEVSEAEESPSEPGENFIMDEEDEPPVEKPKRGRPRKGTQSATGSRRPKSKEPTYVKLTEYSRYAAGPHPISSNCCCIIFISG